MQNNKKEEFEDTKYEWKYGNSKLNTYSDETVKKTNYSNNTYAFRTAQSFLDNLNKKSNNVDLSIYKEGKRVYHKKFGEGTINYVEEEEGEDLKVDISFDKVGHKRLMAKFAGLEVID